MSTYEEIILQESAFLPLVTSAMEVYPTEVIGILISTSSMEGQECKVKYAIPQQTAIRKFTWARFRAPAFQKLIDTIDNMKYTFSKNNKIVGTFHSHTDSWKYKGLPEPSPGDLKSLSEFGEIDIIIAINKATKSLEWGQRREKGKFSGTIGEYHIDLVGYRLLGERFTYIPIWVEI